MEEINFSFEVVKWADQNHVRFAKSKGYCADKSPFLYVLKDADLYTHYELIITYSYQSDVESGLTIEEASIEMDHIGFWAKSKDPCKELFTRILTFYDNQQKVLDYRKAQNDYSCTLEHLPTNTGDRFIEDHIISWAESVDKTLSQIPSEYKEAKLYIEDLEYKYRKMVELFNNVIFNHNLTNEIIEEIENY